MAEAHESTLTQDNLAVRAVVIGLGGTGKEVLLRIRQRFVQELGVAGLPVMRYLLIDCDPDNDFDISGKSFDWLLPEAKLGASELLPATIAQAQISAYVANQGMHPWLFNWIQPQVFALGAILDGASQVRPRGRLGFYENYATIRNSILQAREWIESSEAERELSDRYSMKPAETKRAYVICSLAGGTGSGMFLDAAFLCQQYLPDYEVIGLLVLPTLFGTPEQTPRLFANAYASLMELEHYGMPKDVAEGAAQAVAEGMKQQDTNGRDFKIRRVSTKQLTLGASRHDFVQYWDRQSFPSYVRGPAFDYCYLLDAKSEAGASLQPQRKTDLLDMAAEALYWEFAGGSFASQKRSMRNNLRPHLGTFRTIAYAGKDGSQQYEDVFSNLYSSIGFSTVQVPAVQIRNACGYRLAMELIDHWNVVNPPGATLKDDIVQMLKPKGRPLTVAGTDYAQGLDRDGAGSDFASSTLSTWSNALRRQIDDSGGQGDISGAIQQAIDRLKREAFTSSPGLPPEQQGDLVQMLEANGVRYEAEIDGQLRSLIGRLLDERGVPSTIEFLRQLREVLIDEGERISRHLGEVHQAAEDARRAYEGYGRVIASEQAGKHRAAVKQCALAAVEYATEYLRSEAEARVLDRARGIHARFIEKIMLVGTSLEGEESVEGGWVQRLIRFREALATMRIEFEKALDRYDRAEDHLIFAILYREGMFEDYFKAQRLDVATEKLSLYDAMKIDSTQLLGILDRCERQGRRSAQEGIEAFAIDRFKHMAVSTDAIETLYEWGEKGSITKEQRANLVARFVRGSAPWLPPSGEAKALNFESYSEFVYGRRVGQQSDAYRWFDEEVEPLLGQKPFAAMQPKVRTDAQKQSVLLCCERAAFPLAWIDGIQAYRRCYRDCVLGGGAVQDYFPHIDVKQTGLYADICPLNEEDVTARRRAHKALLLGAILGSVRTSGEVVMYVNEDFLGSREVALGRGRAGALSALMNSPQQLDQVESEANRRLLALSLDGRQHLFAVLYRLLDTALVRTEAVDTTGAFRETWNLDRKIVEELAEQERTKIVDATGGGDGLQERIRKLVADLSSDLPEQDRWYRTVVMDGLTLYQLKD